jgi:phytoene/squalene synthetase
MRRPVPREIFARQAVAWLYLVVFTAAQVADAVLSPHDQAAVLGWASTNVHNLGHDPVGSLVASAFVTQGDPAAWPFLIALARAAAAIDLALLVFAGGIFGGISNLDVAAVGHTTAMIVAAIAGSLLAWQARRRPRRPRPVPGEDPAEVSAGQ